MNNEKPVFLPDENMTIRKAWDLPNNLSQLVSIIGGYEGPAAPQQMEEFLKDPIAKRMPKKLRAEVDAWIARGSSKGKEKTVSGSVRKRISELNKSKRRRRETR